MHLLTLDDFNVLGIKLADMRLLIEKFGKPIKHEKKKADELKQLVSNVRRWHGSKIHSKRRKPEVITVYFSWYNYSQKNRKFSQVKVTCGGGVRQKRMDRYSSFAECLAVAKALFFPGGKSNKGRLGYFWCKLMKFDLSEELSSQLSPGVAFTVDKYIQMFGLKVAKIVLRTKEKSRADKMDSVIAEDSSSDDFPTDEIKTNSISVLKDPSPAVVKVCFGYIICVCYLSI